MENHLLIGLGGTGGRVSRCFPKTNVREIQWRSKA